MTRTPLMSGSLNPTTGKAVPVDGGFRFSGTAMFASGCRHASWLMVGAWVQRDGEPSFTDERSRVRRWSHADGSTCASTTRGR